MSIVLDLLMLGGGIVVAVAGASLLLFIFTFGSCHSHLTKTKRHTVYPAVPRIYCLPDRLINEKGI
ncbi:MAG: hypothetical protein V2I47_09675 [Bacteroidales bacterium]|nr:hypothetical protein [Bacteroidales bacterium]